MSSCFSTPASAGSSYACAATPSHVRSARRRCTVPMVAVGSHHGGHQDPRARRQLHRELRRRRAPGAGRGAALVAQHQGGRRRLDRPARRRPRRVARARAHLVPRRDRERMATSFPPSAEIVHALPPRWAGTSLVTGAVGPRAQLLTRAGAGRVVTTLPRAATSRVLDRIRLIARTLEEEPGLTSPELAERVGFGRRHMSLLLLRLEEHGAVVHEGRRWFPGPETGDLIRG